MPEYTFDVKLWAAAHIEAPSLDDARQALEAVLGASDPDEHFIAGYNSASESSGVKISSFSICPEEGDEPDRIEPIDIDDSPCDEESTE